MTLANEYTLHLDFQRNVANRTPIFTANDTGILYFEITDNGEPYDITYVDRITVTFILPTGINVTGQGVLENGKIKYTMGTTEMVKGTIEAVLQFYQGSTRISTPPFKIKVLEDYVGDIGSQTDQTFLQQLISEVSTIKTTIKTQTFTATEGQSVFTLTLGSYDVGTGTIEVVVGGIPQTTGVGFEETDSTTVTLAEGIPANTTVFCRWFEGSVSLNRPSVEQHGTTRPSSPVLAQRFYDENLSRPIWFNGTSWTDAMGNVV